VKIVLANGPRRADQERACCLNGLAVGRAVPSGPQGSDNSWNVGVWPTSGALGTARPTFTSVGDLGNTPERRRCGGLTHPNRLRRVGAPQHRPASAPFCLVSIPGPLNRLSDQFGCEPSSAAPESIAHKTCLAESPNSRLQPHAAAHPPGTMIGRNQKSGWRSGSHVLRPTMSDDPSQCHYTATPFIGWRPDHPVDLRGRKCPRTRMALR